MAVLPGTWYYTLCMGGVAFLGWWVQVCGASAVYTDTQVTDLCLPRTGLDAVTKS